MHVSYCLDDAQPALVVSLTDNSRLHVELLNNIYDVSIPLAVEQWHHIVIAHNLSQSDSIRILINGSRVVVFISSKPYRYEKRNNQPIIDSSGNFFVGQAMRTINITSNSMKSDFEFDTQRAFYGEITFLNLWQRILSDHELHQLATDCHAQRQECGDAVSWMDFVNDITGEIKIHWPSGIYSLFGKKFLSRNKFLFEYNFLLLQLIVLRNNGFMNLVIIIVVNLRVILFSFYRYKNKNI